MVPDGKRRRFKLGENSGVIYNASGSDNSPILLLRKVADNYASYTSLRADARMIRIFPLFLTEKETNKTKQKLRTITMFRNYYTRMRSEKARSSYSDHNSIRKLYIRSMQEADGFST